jgi:DNA topoisomerase-1
MKLVIVESPTKAKTIEKFLGKDYLVTSSYGHIRDLPNNAAEIPEKYKKEKWTRLGINIEKDFEPLYIVPDKKKKRVAELKQMAKDADMLYLATDEDREGESISWHLLEVLSPKVPVKRLVFHEITKEAIQNSLATAREVDLNLVKAQETRRIIDRLFGYSVSPLLWKKMLPKLSAGRVQSVAMRLLVERERSRISFRSAEYWDLKAKVKKQNDTLGKEAFIAELTHVGDKRIAIGKDFDPDTGILKSAKDVILLDQAQVTKLKQKLQSQNLKVVSVDARPFTQKPAPPFTTSTLQQDGSRKFNFAARRTMTIAQALYENGFITYMRTDSTTLSEEALTASRNLIAKDFGPQFLPDAPRLYATKVKNAQEAHEAIRPAGTSFTPPAVVKAKLGIEAFKLYEMIWMRTVASQMKDAVGTRVSVSLAVDDANFRAAGKTIEFPGFLRAYVEGTDDPDEELADQEKVLPKLDQGELLDFVNLDIQQHETKPPARYTEGSLIKELERLGIGRPSTWATIVDVVLARSYAFKKGPALVPTFLAMALTNLMERYFTTLVDYKFTASLEDDLDAIARGESDSLKYLNKFYHGNGHPGLAGLVTKGDETIDPRDVCGLPLGQTAAGESLEVRIGRYGPFLTDDKQTASASLADMLPPDELTLDKAEVMLGESRKGPQPLGTDPITNLPVYLKKGRYGPYIQLGDAGEGLEKPKMASLLQGQHPDSVDLEIALEILSLPRVVGLNPADNIEIICSNGRYGPYITCGKETRSLTDDLSPLTITLDQALALLKEPKRRGRGTPKKPLRELGKNTVTEREITVKTGTYGPYVTDGELNASVPVGVDYNDLTLEDAINLLENRKRKMEAVEAEGDSEGDEDSGTKAKSKTKSKTKAKPATKTTTKSATKSPSKAKQKKTKKE